MARPTRAHDPARVYRAWVPELPQVVGRRVKQASYVVGALYATAAAADAGTRCGCGTRGTGETSPL